jgi:hypothetical protein
VTGVVTGELRDADGSLVGVDSRRVTLAVDLVRQGDGYVPVAHASRIDLMGLTVHVERTVLDVPLVLPWRAARPRGGPLRAVPPLEPGSA